MNAKMPSWTAEITNNPEKDYSLCIELLQNDVAKARIERNPSGQLVVKIYPTDELVDIPAEWLASVLGGAEKTLQSSQ